MDLLSIAAGFLLGAITGAAGGYFSAKYTDDRRAQESDKADRDAWRDFESRYPELVAEMRADISGSSGHARHFLLLRSGATLNGVSAPSFSYFTDVHTNIQAAVAELKELGYVVDATTSKVPRYRMRESLVQRLKQP